MKALILAAALSSLLTSCGDQSLTGPSLTSKSIGQKQTSGSTVAILDQVVDR